VLFDVLFSRAIDPDKLVTHVLGLFAQEVVVFCYTFSEDGSDIGDL